MISTTITPADFPEIRWRGRWIWVPEEPVEPGGFLHGSVDPHAREAPGLFRKTFHLDHIPERVPARITADSRYAFFANAGPHPRGRAPRAIERVSVPPGDMLRLASGVPLVGDGFTKDDLREVIPCPWTNPILNWRSCSPPSAKPASG